MAKQNIINMHRFFSPNLTATTHALEITDSREIHHLKNVLRLKKDNVITIFNGKGAEGQAIIQLVSESCIKLHLDAISVEAPKKFLIILACAIPKKAKFETIIEKCTELGVDEIIPIKTQRTEFALSIERMAKKNARYQTVAINAAKQSKRKTVPVIHPITDFKKALETFSGVETLSFIPCLTGNRVSLPQAFQKLSTPAQKIIIFIGPEGDFTPEEVKTAVQSGCVPVSLGETVLKVDTAAISAISFAKLFYCHEK